MNRIDHQHARRHLLHVAEDGLQVGLGEKEEILRQIATVVADRHQALLVSLAHDPYDPQAEIHIPEAKAHQL